LYKDEQFYIYLKFADQTIQKYLDPTNPHKQKKVIEIALDASNKKILTDKLEVKWEAINFINAPNCPNLFFGKTKSPYLTLVTSIQNFEYPIDTLWSRLFNRSITQEEALSGKNALKINPLSYSCSYQVLLDSNLVGKRIQVTSSCWVKGAKREATKKISLVSSITNKEKENLLWENQILYRHLVDEKTWNCINQTINYQPEKKGETLDIYLWNNTKEAIIIDDIQVSIRLLDN